MWTAGSLTLNPCQPDSNSQDCTVDGADSPRVSRAQPPSAVVFEQPWQAQIFALVVQLNERGVFSWPEWSATLGEVLADSSDGAWEHWPVALERLLVRRGIAAPGALVALRQAWQMADESTPHGQPVRLGSGVRRLSGGSAPDAVPGLVNGPGRARNP